MDFRGASLLTFLFLPACATLFISCKKLLTVPPPLSQISSSSVFGSDAGVSKAMTGLYIQMMGNTGSLLNGGVTIYAGLSADELINTYPDPVESPFRSNSLAADNIAVAGLYDSGYALIYTANSLLAGMKGSSGISAGVKQRLRGEAVFSRALVYFYLVNLYGAVPLVTTTDFTISSKLPRSEPAAVYRQIVDDLQTAQLDLPAAASSSDRTLPTRGAASALLARVYLYLGLWAQADSAASAVIGNSFYRLEPDLDSVFLAGSRETIWQLQPAYEDMATAEGAAFIPAAPFLPPQYTLTQTLLNSYESGDQRRIHWTAATSGGKVYPYKYKQASYDSTVPAEYNVVLRLAETMLIRAEARVNEGNLTGAEDDLNIVRYRSGLPAITAENTGDLLTAIRHERQIELAAEWGHRWLDLKRTGQADQVLGMEKTGWKPAAALYPIPAAELPKNPHLLQNQGY
jgi:hypothetical protein